MGSKDIAVQAVLAVEQECDVAGWGEEATVVFVVVSDEDKLAFGQLLTVDGHPVEMMDQLLEGGYGLGSEPLILGVAFVSEAWRHLDDDELRAALPPDALDGMFGIEDPEVWAGTAELLRKRTRPRDLPDHLRREVRIAALLLRDGTVAQACRDRGSSDVTTDCSPLSDFPDNAYMPWAMHRMLTTVGDVLLGRE